MDNTEVSNKPIEIFIISDSIGETINKITMAVLSQFPTVTNFEIKKFPFVTTRKELVDILNDALKINAIVATTLVKDELNDIVAEFHQKTQLNIINYMQPFLKIVEKRTNVHPIQKASAQYELSTQYFDRVEAIEFAVKYDDGKDPRGFALADFVILGISRTSKTPVSMYLANKGYKVANLPLIPEVPVPKELFDVPSENLIGLVSDAETIQRFRKARLKAFGLSQNASYSELDRIQEEIDYAISIYKRTKAHIINVNNMAIEETAQKIEALR